MIGLISFHQARAQILRFYGLIMFWNEFRIHKTSKFGLFVIKSSLSNFNLRSPGSYLVRSYLITTVCTLMLCWQRLKSIYFFSDWLWTYCDVVFTWVSHGWFCFFLFHWFAITFGIRFFFPAWWLFSLLYDIYSQSQNKIGKWFICLYLGGKT